MNQPVPDQQIRTGLWCFCAKSPRCHPGLNAQEAFSLNFSVIKIIPQSFYLKVEGPRKMRTEPLNQMVESKLSEPIEPVELRQ
jgi:hypothetical protein